MLIQSNMVRLKKYYYLRNRKKEDKYMEIKNVYKESWEQALLNKTKEELVYIIQHKENYAPEFISMVEEKLEKEYGVTNVEPTPNVVLPWYEALRKGNRLSQQ